MANGKERMVIGDFQLAISIRNHKSIITNHECLHVERIAMRGRQSFSQPS
jgi:hypothetical protein